MTRSSITALLIPEVRDGPFVLGGDVADAFWRARESGFDAVELCACPEHLSDLDGVRQCLERYELPLSAVGTGAGYLLRGLHEIHRWRPRRRRGGEATVARRDSACGSVSPMERRTA